MKRVLLSALLAWWMLAAAGCYTNPVTGRSSFVAVSQEHELALGAQSFTELRRVQKVSNDPAANARVRRVGERIAKAVGDQLPGAKWEFVVFESKDINAFALPGGKVGVYTGLLTVAESDDQLAIVMGHEIGHVIARHGAERMTQAMTIAGIGLVGAVVADQKYGAETRNIFLASYGGLTTAGVVLPHSRRNESEADRMGLVYAARAGYDPRAAVVFWQRMAQAKDGAKGGAKLPAWLSTHPSDQQRIADLQALMPDVVPIYEAGRTQTN